MSNPINQELIMEIVVPIQIQWELWIIQYQQHQSVFKAKKRHTIQFTTHNKMHSRTILLTRTMHNSYFFLLISLSFLLSLISDRWSFPGHLLYPIKVRIKVIWSFKLMNLILLILKVLSCKLKHRNNISFIKTKC